MPGTSVEPTKPLCKLCGSPWHYKTFCLLNTKKAIAKRNPIQTVGKETKKWIATRVIWFKENWPNDQGFYICYLCGKWLDQKETTLDHVIPRSHDPKLRYELSNLKPCCFTCNSLKGSQSLDHYTKGKDYA